MQGLRLDAARLARERARGLWPQRVATDYLDRWVHERPESTALVAWRTEDEAETRLTWRQLARAAAAADALERAGVGRGDVVSFQLPNWWEFVALYLATVRLAVANPLMPIFRRRELSFMLRLAESHVLIAPERFRGFDHGALARELAASFPACGSWARFRKSARDVLRARCSSPTTSRSSSTPRARPASRRACCTLPTRCSARFANSQAHGPRKER